MKATQRDFAQAARRAAAQARVFFFCGPDEAGAAAAAQKMVTMLPDAGERVELSGADLRKDPVLLGDEARSTSLFGGSRHIWVRANGDEALDAIGNHLIGHGDACPVLIVATGATDKSRTAKLLEKRDDALVAMFWPPELRDVTQSVRAMGDAAGLRLNGDLAERIARGAGLDVRLAQSEVSKLALYLDASPEAPKNADAAALAEIGAATEEDGFMPIVNAVLSGDRPKLAGEFARLRELALNPVGLLLAFERRAAQLAQLAARLGRGGDVHGFLKGEERARRVFFKDVRDLEAQLTRWRGEPLERLIVNLAALHRSLLANSQASEVLLAQGLTDIARQAARQRRN